MAELFPQVVNMSIAASWMVPVAAVLRLLLKRAPRWISCLLWALVAVRLICPFSLESGWSLLPSAETIPEELFFMEPDENRRNTVLEVEVNPVIPGSYTPEIDMTIDRLQVKELYAALGWTAGVAVLLAYAGVSYLRLRSRMKTAVRLRDNIYQSEHAASPFVLGLLRPRIYLPFGLAEQDAAHVIAHEQAHIRRCDHWSKLLGFLLLALHWFNPLVWAAYILFCRDMELACDERVVRELGAGQRADYSQALLTCSVSRGRIAACPLAFGEVGVKARVRNVLNYKKPAFWMVAVAILACAAVAVCFLTNPKENAPPAASPFAQGYRVESVVYSAAYYDFSYTPETAPLYSLTSDGRLMILEDKKSGAWLQAGTFLETELTRENFDRCFKIDILWDGASADRLRGENAKAWRVVVSPDIPDSVFYYLLQQKNGDVYLTYGYCDRSEEADAPSEVSSIRWVFKLTRSGLPDGYAESGGLDAAVTAAILEQQGSGTPDGLIRVESHVVFDTLITPDDPAKRDSDFTAAVCALVLYQEYSAYDGELTEVGGSHIPTKLTFRGDTAGHYTLTEYWVPRDGGDCAADVAEQFPKGAAAQAMDARRYIGRQQSECQEKARAILDGAGAVQQEIAALLDTICAAPTASSAPGDAVEAHPEAYRKLLSYGDDALRYLFSEFLAGGQTDLRGHVMRIALEELIGGEALKLHAATGQEYFDAWLENARKAERERGGGYVAEHLPKAWMLLQMEGTDFPR